MTDIEIPLVSERSKLYRFFERLPLLLSILVLVFPLALSFFNATLAGYYVVGFVVIWFVRALAMTVRVFQGHKRMTLAMHLDWNELLNDVDNYEEAIEKYKNENTFVERAHYYHLLTYKNADQKKLKSKDVIHVVMVATYNESLDVLQPTFEAIKDSDYDVKNKVIVCLAYEERAGERTEANAKKLLKDYKSEFKDMFIVKHPDGLPNEVRGKGGNITYAGKELRQRLEKQKIDFERVLVTTLDADNHPHKNYLSTMTYAYLTSKDRQYKSFQPVSLYTKNVWDVPAVARVLAMANSFWTIMQNLRPHLLRNFSSHAQPMQAIVDSDYWSTRSVVEDGHQFWRTYFAYDGKHDVVPTFAPIYQDAVLVEGGYRKTLRAQFVQLRRWAWGCSDIAYVTTKGFFEKNNIPLMDLIFKWMRLVDTHVSWATASLVIAFAAWGPRLLNPEGADNIVAQQLPGFVSYLSTLSLAGIIFVMYLSFRILPARPSEYGKKHHMLMLLQWILVPFISILYGSFSAINAQTRLFFGRYLGFDVTEKGVKKGKTVKS